MNARAKIDREPEDRVAAEFLSRRLQVTADVRSETFLRRLWGRLGEHLALVAISLAAAIAVAIPLGVVAARFRRLGALYPDTKGSFGIGGLNIPSIRPVSLRLRDAVTKLGWNVVDLQNQPALVDNWRPYMEEFKAKGVKAFQEINSLDITPLIRAMNDVGWKPESGSP